MPVCKTLQESGIEYDCLEASDRVGGVWNIEFGGSGYRSLRTNTSTRTMAYSDFPFAENSPVHPNSSEMVDYFRSYAEHFKILDNIHFNSRVKNITPDADDNWQVELDSGEVRQYSNVIVATGKYSKAKHPHDQIEGEFNGQFIHSAEYLDALTPLDLSGKRVVVVGLGSSAVEIACDLANDSSPLAHASKVILSARSGRWIVPKIIDGKPADALAPHPSEKLPWLFDLIPKSIGEAIMRRSIGKRFRALFTEIQAGLEFKLPQPKIFPWAERPTLSLDFLPFLQSGKITLAPGIDRFDNSRVTFLNGEVEEVDAIIYATGYTLDFPFISEPVLTGPAADLSLYQNVAHPTRPGLFFVGCLPVLCSMWPVAEQQSKWIAELIKGSFKLPSQSQQARSSKPLEESLPVICGFYVHRLRKEAKGASS